ARPRAHDGRTGRGTCAEPDQGSVPVAWHRGLGQERLLGEGPRGVPGETARRDAWGNEDDVHAVRRGGRDPAAGRERPRQAGAPAPDESRARIVSRPGSNPGGADDPDRGVAGAVPDQATVLVVLWT